MIATYFNIPVERLIFGFTNLDAYMINYDPNKMKFKKKSSKRIKSKHKKYYYA